VFALAKVDMCSATRGVSFGPKADSCCGKQHPYDYFVVCRDGTVRLGGVEVDRELVFRRLLKWPIAGFFPAQNAVDVGCGTANWNIGVPTTATLCALKTTLPNFNASAACAR
jgi:hypothetical protein